MCVVAKRGSGKSKSYTNNQSHCNILKNRSNQWYKYTFRCNTIIYFLSTLKFIVFQFVNQYQVPDLSMWTVVVKSIFILCYQRVRLHSFYDSNFWTWMMVDSTRSQKGTTSSLLCYHTVRKAFDDIKIKINIMTVCNQMTCIGEYMLLLIH